MSNNTLLTFIIQIFSNRVKKVGLVSPPIFSTPTMVYTMQTHGVYLDIGTQFGNMRLHPPIL